MCTCTGRWLLVVRLCGLAAGLWAGSGGAATDRDGAPFRGSSGQVAELRGSVDCDGQRLVRFMWAPGPTPIEHDAITVVDQELWPLSVQERAWSVAFILPFTHCDHLHIYIGHGLYTSQGTPLHMNEIGSTLQGVQFSYTSAAGTYPGRRREVSASCKKERKGQQSAFLQEAISLQNPMLAIVEPLLAPLTDTTVTLLLHGMEDVKSNFQHAASSSVPPKAAQFVADAFVRNFTNSVSDAIPKYLNPRLSRALAVALRDSVSDALQSQLPLDVARKSNAIHINTHMVDTFSAELYRVVSTQLTSNLCSALPRALVPPLQLGMQFTPQHMASCHSCAASPPACETCPYTAKNIAYWVALSDHFHDAYNPGIVQYYSDALQSILDTEFTSIR